MCGRYVLALRSAQLCQHFQSAGLPVDDACADDAVRQSYNVAPGYLEPVYVNTSTPEAVRWALTAKKFGLQLFRNGKKIVNTRTESLEPHQASGLWDKLKHQQRCVIPAEGFYEWKDHKLPHYVKRVDGQLMFLAGLWDKDQFSIITTAANDQMAFLHHRMPVILEPDDVKAWLDPSRTRWSGDLQKLLRPFEGSLSIYPVSREVGKVGNDSPSFVEPIGERKDGIKSFFGMQNVKKEVKKEDEQKEQVKEEEKLGEKGVGVKEEENDISHPPPTPEYKKRKASSPLPTSPPVKTAKTTTTRSATTNRSQRTSQKKTPAPKKTAGGNRKITSFFK
ncbi:hypothetical protein FN846DRAFT_891278 [Sphaerosporella brunnea]|uniref:DUF159-domain-containing protein n=1 Tax=Sphaerosporella brunnea TaxID=1250544 RepID=A0A5J5ETP4_9PEZI|nr:hypothetical protein FN846DRAFT_891278 [Sphaerosporella brunnea]